MQKSKILYLTYRSIIDAIMKSNQELRSKINISNQKYEEILSQIKEKENEKSEASLAKQIKELEKEISVRI